MLASILHQGRSVTDGCASTEAIQADAGLLLPVRVLVVLISSLAPPDVTALLAGASPACPSEYPSLLLMCSLCLDEPVIVDAFSLGMPSRAVDVAFRRGSWT